MSENQDKRIADLLNEDAPPARDPLFRVRVLERREHRQFQRRSFTMLAGALVILLVSTLAISIGGGALKTTGALVVVAALVSAYLAFRHRLSRMLRRFTI